MKVELGQSMAEQRGYPPSRKPIPARGFIERSKDSMKQYGVDKVVKGAGQVFEDIIQEIK